jgi:hypothetical protein
MANPDPRRLLLSRHVDSRVKLRALRDRVLQQEDLNFLLTNRKRPANPS